MKINFNTHRADFLKKQNKTCQLLMRKLKRKVKNSVEYKNESRYHYLARDYFSMRENEKRK